MKVLVACEKSGVIREAFRAKGHDAWSCDLVPCEDNSEFHFEQDVLEILYDECWELLIAHPPCTYLANSGVHWLHRDKSRWPKMIEAAIFFRAFLCAGIRHICVENPVIHKYALEHIGMKYTQTIQPYEFGHPESKRTCLWLINLPALRKTDVLAKPEKGYWLNQTPSGQNKLGPSIDRSTIRARTYRGIAQAMADQWDKPKNQMLFDK